MVGLVAAGEGIALLPSVLLPPTMTGVMLRSLEDAPVWYFGMGWRRQRPTPIAELGRRLIRQLVPRAVHV